MKKNIVLMVCFCLLVYGRLHAQQSGFNNSVYTIVANGNKPIVGGKFTSVREEEHNRIVRLQEDNTPWDNTRKQDTKVIITGYVTNPAGADANREYVQLMATEYINFAATPYSVITCYTSYSGNWTTKAPAQGWVTGTIPSTQAPPKDVNDPTSQTTKFNITSGEVQAGDFFYIGGSNKRINGGSSTDISETATVVANRAKWGRVITYGSTPWTGDDGVGGGIFGALFGNSEAPQGVAVFNTTNVTEATMPIDVVFFGTSPTTETNQKKLYDNSGSTELGYRICNTDRYSTENGEFFLKGSNTYLFGPETSADATAQGKFYQLRGTYDAIAKKWIEPRIVTEITMTTTSPLSLIETGYTYTTLPVNIVSVKAEVLAKAVRLHWTTASETNNAYFEVLRSNNQADFASIGKITGNNAAHDYVFTDYSPLPGTAYYKLRQVDLDGTAIEFNVIAVKSGLNPDKLNMAVNVGDNMLRLFTQSAENTEALLTVTDISGKKVLEKKINLINGNAVYQEPFDQPKGIYVISLKTNKERAVLKFGK
ncbi:T9SS type A sorting domain-containing protein [Pedobacter sp. BS3]|uniref:T9SS type A sorting domain-containing protein n=1 Tax=Pedobacter sp. BS3 TaxID=2567937 RepID=UPI0011EC1878|nr:T9SS type A sorting domain-containing protein [Pedobacter sp. BS3]TZF83121.1 T9SS type A sorting domain-containing protein [Pedobacter sp. BS3]